VSGAAVCAQPVSGTADITGLNLMVPNGGGGLIQNVQVSYSGVGTSGLTPSTTSRVYLTYMKYTSGGTTTPVGTGVIGGSLSIGAPTMTLEGSVPVVTVTQAAPASGLILGGTNQIGQVTVAASSQGAIRVNTITFNVGNSGFSGSPTLSVPTLDNGSTPITGAYCTTNGSTTVTCIFNSTGASGGATGYQYDFIIGGGQSQTFNLFANVAGSATSGVKASVSSAVTASGFIWDDASNNGGTGSTGLTGATPGIIYNFPTNSYTISQ
jgi:hypothetical protein